MGNVQLSIKYHKEFFLFYKGTAAAKMTQAASPALHPAAGCNQTALQHVDVSTGTNILRTHLNVFSGS